MLRQESRSFKCGESALLELSAEAYLLLAVQKVCLEGGDFDSKGATGGKGQGFSQEKPTLQQVPLCVLE